MAPKISLKLFVDEEKHKIVLAETNNDFVDVLFSLLTLPMGTIVKMFEKHRESTKPITIGCYNNLYKSVADMDVEHFETEACREILFNPRSSSELKCQRLSININPNDDLKFFMCPRSCKLCSNFSTSQCKCGNLMRCELQFNPQDSDRTQDDDVGGVFVSDRYSYVITDDLKVAVLSTGFIVKNLKSQGYCSVSKIKEMVVDITTDEVLTLVECMFTSNAPLTDTFLKKKQYPQVRSTIFKCMEKESVSEDEKLITLNALLRKHDKKILNVECEQDFVDLLFAFLAVPLESALEKTTYGCIGNLLGSFKDLCVSNNEGTTYKPMFHHYYKCKNQLLDIITEKPPVYHRHCNVLKTMTNSTLGDVVVMMDPKSHGSEQSSGFVKRDTKFTVSDDLIITPMTTTSSTINYLNKLQIRAEDLDVQEIKITKTEARNLLRASLVTSSALNTCLKNLIETSNEYVYADYIVHIPEEPEIETLRCNVSNGVLANAQSL